MKPESGADTLIKDYLLGNLRQEEALQVEERLFFDHDYFQALQVVEDDLIDDYVYGELSTNERERFENYFLSTPERYEALRLAKTLKGYISRKVVLAASPEASAVKPLLTPRIPLLQFLHSQNALWRLSLAFATLLLIIGGIWLLVWNVSSIKRTPSVQVAERPPSVENKNSNEPKVSSTNSNVEQQKEQESQSSQQNQGAPDRESAPGEKSSPSPQPSPNRNYPPNLQPGRPKTTVYALLIPGALSRGDDYLKEVRLPAHASTIILRLALVEDNDYRTFKVELFTDDDRAIRSWKGLNAKDSKAGKVVSVNVPASLLDQQNYHIKLSGISKNGSVAEINGYYFRVTRKIKSL